MNGRVLCLILIPALRVLAHDSWLPAFEYAAPRCTIERVPLQAITQSDFESFFLEQSPVIFQGTSQERLSASTQKVRTAEKAEVLACTVACSCWLIRSFATELLCGMQRVLLRDYGSTTVKLSSANTFSHGSTHIKLQEYIDSFSLTDTRNARANESFYLFGPHAALSPRLSELVVQYLPPLFAASDLAFSFGIGAHATGIPFHVHGHGFSEVIHGSKVLCFAVIYVLLERDALQLKHVLVCSLETLLSCDGSACSSSMM
jgi:hypothetical protein